MAEMVIPDSNINPNILFDQENISAKTRLSIEEIGVFAINKTLIEYERNPSINVLEMVTSTMLDLTRSRDSKKGNIVDTYSDTARVRIMSLRNLPRMMKVSFKFIVLEGDMIGKVIDVHETRISYAKTLMNRGLIKPMCPSHVYHLMLGA